jgi:hypothetical protein
MLPDGSHNPVTLPVARRSLWTRDVDAQTGVGGVEDAGGVGGRGEQVHAAIHVEQRRLHAPIQECGHHRDGEVAFAAQDQRDPSVGEDLARPPAGLAEHAEHRLEVVGPALVRVGPPPHHGQVAVVRDAHAGRGQPLGQSGSAQRGRRLLLPRPCVAALEGTPSRPNSPIVATSSGTEEQPILRLTA